jgi:hypothetical protein
MKLREILTAGVATLALTGAASANDLTAVAANSDATAIPVLFASELTGDVDGMGFQVLLAPTSGATYLDTNQIITLTFTGATIDGTSFAIDNDGSANTCAGNYSVSSGGGAGDSSVTIVADTLSGCDGSANDSIVIDVDLDIANGTAASMSATVVTEGGGTAVGGGASDALSLATWGAAFDLDITADATPPIAQLSDFTSFDSGVMGNITLAETTGTQVRLDGTTAVTVATDVDDIDVTVTGDMAGIATIEGAAPASGVSTFALGAGAANEDIDVVADGTNAITGGDYTVSATLDLGGDAAFTTPTAQTATFTIDRAGSDLVFPYTLDGTTIAAFPGTVVSYRISNSSATATGPAMLQLRSWDNATGVTTTPVELAASIPANGDLVFTPADVEALVGAYGVGDFVVNVEAAAANLEASYTQVSNGGVTNFEIAD